MSFSHLFTVFRREMAAYFNSAIAYIFIIVFVILNGGLFMTQFFLVGNADMRSFFSTLPFVLSIFLPAVSMRLWAEERRGNTLELLLTFPMGTHELVLGKFLASLAFYLTALCATLTIPAMLLTLGNPDFGIVIGGYLGAVLLGAFFLAIGIFVSGLCRDQIVAFILSMIICYGLHLVGSEYIASSIDGWIPGVGTLLRHHVGSSGHFEAFGRGVIDNKDVFYFLMGTAAFLVLNGFWLEGRLRPGAKKLFMTATMVAFGILFLSNWLLSTFSIGRFDMTQGGIYTISPATKKILRGLDAPIIAKLYISPMDKMPTGMKSLERDIVDKLDEFRIASEGNFQYKIFHMEAANIVEGVDTGEGPSLEQQLQQKGIQPFQVRAIVSDEMAVRLVYSSINLSYKDKADELISRIIPDKFHELEYTIVSKIYRMTLDEEPTAALVAPYEEKEVPEGIRSLLAQLGGGSMPSDYKDDKYEIIELALDHEGFPVKRIRLTESEPIPEDTKTLIVVNPENLNDRQRYEINRFLYEGGSVFLAVQRYEYQYSVSGSSIAIIPSKKEIGINALLEHWGFGVDDQILLDEEHDIINLSGSGAQYGPFGLTIPVKVPFHIRVTQSGMNPNVSITSRLSPLVYLWGTALTQDGKQIESQKLEVLTLLSSSTGSWKIPFQTETIRSSDLEPRNNSPVGPFPLAILARGQFANAFNDGLIPPWPKQEDENMEEPEEEGKEKEMEGSNYEALVGAPGQLVLIGDARMFDRELIRGEGHLPFFLNSISAITLGEDLVTIRSKQAVNRSIGRISTATKVGWRLFVTVLTPLLVAAIGAFQVVLRKQSKHNYLKALLISS